MSDPSEGGHFVDEVPVFIGLWLVVRQQPDVAPSPLTRLPTTVANWEGCPRGQPRAGSHSRCRQTPPSRESVGPRDSPLPLRLGRALSRLDQLSSAARAGDTGEPGYSGGVATATGRHMVTLSCRWPIRTTINATPDADALPRKHETPGALSTPSKSRTGCVGHNGRRVAGSCAVADHYTAR